ncbi:MAG: tetratricopeptide repeat protein, partial [Kiloniellales bacterium]
EPAPEPPPVKKGEDEESSLTDPGQKLKLPPRVQAAMRTPVRLAPGGDGYAAFKGGYAAARSGKLDLAIDLYTRAIDTGDLELEHLAEAFYNRANAHHYLGALKFAIQDYSAAILNKPDFPGAYYNRGFAFEANGQHTRALADFMKARKLGLQRLGVRSPDLQPPLP